MKYTYTKETDQNWEYIKRSDGAVIPMDEGNADYQAYLNKDTLASELSNPSTPQAGE